MFEVAAITDCGKTREKNEDACLVNENVVYEGELYLANMEVPFLLAVADGMGGHASGEIASAILLDYLSNTLPTTRDEIYDRLQEANQLIVKYGISNPGSAGLGTTIAGVVYSNNKITIFHVGDSRVYRYRDGFLKKVTRDHSVVELLIEMGRIGKEDVQNHPDKNKLTKFVGTKDNRQLEPSIQELRGSFEENDVYVICSDGLTDMLSDVEIETIMRQISRLDERLRALADAANEKGGMDNITIVAVQRRSELTELPEK